MSNPFDSDGDEGESPAASPAPVPAVVPSSSSSSAAAAAAAASRPLPPLPANPNPNQRPTSQTQAQSQPQQRKISVPSSSALSFPEFARKSKNPFDDDDGGDGGSTSSNYYDGDQLAAKLKTLRDMGFTDDKRNGDMLKQANGSVDHAIELLVQGRPTPPLPNRPSALPPLPQPPQQQQQQPAVAPALPQRAPSISLSAASASSAQQESREHQQLMNTANRMAEHFSRFMNKKSSGMSSNEPSFKKRSAADDPDMVPDTVLHLVDKEDMARGDGSETSASQSADLQMDEFIFDDENMDSLANHIDHLDKTDSSAPSTPSLPAITSPAAVATAVTPPQRPPRRKWGPDILNDEEDDLPPMAQQKSSENEQLTGLQAQVAEQQGELDSLVFENKMLRRKIALLRQARLNIQSPAETVELMLQREPFMLDHLRGLDDKQELLEAAIASHDSEVILEAALFLRRTLKKSRFLGLLKGYPSAIDNLVAFWKKKYEFDLVAELLTDLGRSRERALFEWWRCYRVANPGERLHALERCLGVFLKDPAMAGDVPHLSEQVDLLKLQLSIDAIDAKYEQEDVSFKKMPRQQLIYLSTIRTLSYCGMYHFGAPPDAQSSPVSFKSRFKIGDKAYTYSLLLMRARLRDWTSLPQLLTTTSSMFFSATTKSCIGFEPFVRETIRNQAPREVIVLYLKYLEPWRRYQVASDIKFHDVAIDSLIQLRHRNELIDYIHKPDMAGYRQAKETAESALRDPKIKWKTFKNK